MIDEFPALREPPQRLFGILLRVHDEPLEGVDQLFGHVLGRDVGLRELVVHAGARAQDVRDPPPPPLPKVVARQALLKWQTEYVSLIIDF